MPLIDEVPGGRPCWAARALYDPLPGGAGYARAVGGTPARRLISRDIRNYGNNWIRPSLNRHLALAIIRLVRTGPLPINDPTGTQWLGVHHPLVDPHAVSSPLIVATRVLLPSLHKDRRFNDISEGIASTSSTAFTPTPTTSRDSAR